MELRTLTTTDIEAMQAVELDAVDRDTLKILEMCKLILRYPKRSAFWIIYARLGTHIVIVMTNIQ